MILYFYNKESEGEIGSYLTEDGSFDDDWGSTIPTGAGALFKAPHPSCAKESLVAFGHGPYLGIYDNSTVTIEREKLNFGENAEVADIIFHANQWWIAVNLGVSTGSNRNTSQIYLYDGGATSAILADETAVGMQKIGFLYVLNGVVYVAYQDLSFDGGYSIGYVSDRQLKPLGFFKGSLPNYQQKTLYKNTILFVSSGDIWSAGAVIPSLPFQMSKLASTGYSTVGALAAPFGTPMVASSTTIEFTAELVESAYVLTCYTAHGLVNGNTVILTTDNTLPAGLSTGTIYYVVSATELTFALSLSEGGDPVTVTDSGSGTHYWNRYKLCTFYDHSITSYWKSIVIPLVNSVGEGFIDEIRVLTPSLGADARCDLFLEADQATVTGTSKVITGTGIQYHAFRGFGVDKVKDFRVCLDWQYGNATNDCPIRKIIIKGHTVEN